MGKVRASHSTWWRSQLLSCKASATAGSRTPGALSQVADVEAELVALARGSLRFRPVAARSSRAQRRAVSEHAEGAGGVIVLRTRNSACRKTRVGGSG